MKKITFLFLVALFFSITNINAGDWTGNVNIILGQKSLDKDDWKPLEGQVEFAIETDFREKTWPFNIAIGFVGTADKEELDYNVDLEGTTAETNIGIKKIWENSGNIRPFIGGGLSLITAETKASSEGVSVSLDDSGTGFWLSTGIYWTLGGHFNLGVEAKYSTAEISIGDFDVEAGGTHVGGLVGFHW
jgi:hypothetical protein